MYQTYAPVRMGVEFYSGASSLIDRGERAVRALLIVGLRLDAAPHPWQPRRMRTSFPTRVVCTCSQLPTSPSGTGKELDSVLLSPAVSRSRAVRLRALTRLSIPPSLRPCALPVSALLVLTHWHAILPLQSRREAGIRCLWRGPRRVGAQDGKARGNKSDQR